MYDYVPWQFGIPAALIATVVAIVLEVRGRRHDNHQ